MTVCKQLNYLRDSCRYGGGYFERLVLDGEYEGRNWSVIETEYVEEITWHRGRYHYSLRVDASEFYRGYGEGINCGMTYESLQDYLVLDFGPYGKKRAGCCNQSPGLWENGFNPNFWIDAEFVSYMDSADKIRKIALGEPSPLAADWASIVPKIVDGLKPMFSAFESFAPKSVPYDCCWGAEKRPSPRKPVLLDAV